MSYKYVRFDGVSLPLYDHRQAHTPMAAESALRDSIGGAYDWRGTKRKKGRKQTIPISGVYLGETEYLIDELYNYIVDESGNRIIAGNGYQVLQSQIDDLMAKVGVRGQLWREHIYDGTLEWKMARLLQMPWPRTFEDKGVIANVSCTFETSMEFWHAETATENSVNAVASTPISLNLTNLGQEIDDAVLTVTHTSGTITVIAIVDYANGISWTWTGSLSGGNTLTFDCGAKTIRLGDSDSYSGFALGSLHSGAGWLPLAAGENSLSVTLAGGNATVTVSHYNQYP